ncbi:MFS transporter [Bacillus paralicheniformis]|uniref:MFS transporter n=1 Tax=Bacillus paralicheniformis TaxID=1648923 RepID=UPI000D03DCAE|nr:MFS transporter [Bacillus paralicheniformis]
MSVNQSIFQGNKRKAGLGFIFVTVLFDFLGMGIIAPLYAFYVMQFSTSVLMIGLLATSYAVMQFISAPILGAISDRHGRRPVLLISQLGGAISFLIFALSNTLWLLFLCRIMSGIFGGNLSTAQAYIADVTSVEKRSRGYAIFGLAGSIGFLLGPILAGLTVDFGLSAPAFVATFLAFCNFFYGLFFLPESLPVEKRGKSKQFNPFLTIYKSLTKPRFNMIVIGIFSVYLCQMTIQTIISVFSLDRLGFGPSEVSYLLAYLGFLSIVFNFFLLKYIMKASDKWLGIFCFASLALGYLGVVFSYHLVTIMLSLLLISIGNVGILPCLNGRLSKLTSMTEQGQVMGASQSMTSVAAIVGPFLSSWLYEVTGQSGPWLAASIYTFVALLLYLYSFKTDKVKDVATPV